MEDGTNLIHINQSVNLYLKEEESEVIKLIWFEPKISNCQDLMETVEKWVEEVKLHEDLIETSGKDITPMDTVSNVSVNQKSGKSSKRSSQAS